MSTRFHGTASHYADHLLATTKKSTPNQRSIFTLSSPTLTEERQEMIGS
ncbi:MAG: hypothetical protein IJ761_04300 [Bacteroidales bacterium]|nr:hypothetical protein [Bacteroidales bacterium]